MKKSGIILLLVASIGIADTGCKSMKKSQKGAIIGAAGGAAVGAAIGNSYNKTALGAIIGAAVGGTAGAIVGHQMDKQAEEIKKKVPGVEVKRVGEGIIVEFNEKILFGFDQSTLNSSARTNLDNLVTVLNDYPNTNIEVQGHTDSKGTEAYNLGLSQRRAGTVASYLLQKGIASGRINTKGYGETAPVASNDTEDGRAQNRRVDFVITANEKMINDAKKQASG
ncbi:MAG TPA: OmpA family protein, partial [Chitinophagaceae bacterium]|nr:OmpA family protein [Chitinophagaceae bacterium]